MEYSVIAFCNDWELIMDWRYLDVDDADDSEKAVGRVTVMSLDMSLATAATKSGRSIM